MTLQTLTLVKRIRSAGYIKKKNIYTASFHQAQSPPDRLPYGYALFHSYTSITALLCGDLQVLYTTHAYFLLMDQLTFIEKSHFRVTFKVKSHFTLVNQKYCNHSVSYAKQITLMYI